MKRYLGTALTIAVAISPVLLWLVFNPNPLLLTGASQKFDALARVTALSGLALLSFNIILSARLRVFDRLFLGLDRAYRAHRLIGGSVLILLMAHAGFMTAKYSSISLLSGYEFLKPSLDVALMIGKLTLGIMMVLVVISLYIKIRYQWFIMVQRLLGAMLFLGGYHALFVSGSDLRANTPLFLYFMVLGGSAAGLYIYRSLFHKSLRRKLDYTVERVRHSQNVTVVWLKPVHRALAFYAGQFAFFQFSSLAVDTESHPFSISSDSDSEQLRIAAKASGDYTKELAKLQPGDGVKVEGPFGQFSFAKISGRTQVWVAGGIGITPFLSMIHSLPSDYKVTLYYCVRTQAEAIFLPELQKVATQKPGLQIVLVADDAGQRVTGNMLTSKPADEYLLCAPPSMMHSLEQQLKARGVSGRHIYYEDFALS